MSSFFPEIESALKEPNGLLAVGGDLSSDTLLEAYKRGIFPWFTDNENIMWWSPDPRAVICLKRLHISKKTKQFLKKHTFKLTINNAFNKVITSCARKEKKTEEIWITNRMIEAYNILYSEGFAHSFEVWSETKLVGGLYGIAMGKIFSAESMFFKTSEASKIALLFACSQIYKMGFVWLDCQIMNPHLSSMGAINISRDEFKKSLLIDCSISNEKLKYKKLKPFWPDTKKLLEYYLSKKRII